MWLPKAPRLCGCSELDKLLTQLGNFQPKLGIQVGLRCPSCPRQCPVLWYPIPDLRGNAGAGWRDATGFKCCTAGRGNAPALCWFVLVQAGPQPGLLSERKESGSVAPHEEAEQKSQCSRHIMNSSSIRASFSRPKSFLLLRTTARIQRTNEKQIAINSQFSFKRPPNLYFVPVQRTEM